MKPMKRENRRHKRKASSFPIQYRDIRKSGSLASGSVTGNISEGGVYFKSSEFIPLTGRLALEISLPTLSRPVKAISKVAWIRRILPSGQYEVGSQFLEMTREDRKTVADFVMSDIV